MGMGELIALSVLSPRALVGEWAPVSTSPAPLPPGLALARNPELPGPYQPPHRCRLALACPWAANVSERSVPVNLAAPRAVAYRLPMLSHLFRARSPWPVARWGHRYHAALPVPSPHQLSKATRGQALTVGAIPHRNGRVVAARCARHPGPPPGARFANLAPRERPRDNRGVYRPPPPPPCLNAHALSLPTLLAFIKPFEALLKNSFFGLVFGPAGAVLGRVAGPLPGTRGPWSRAWAGPWRAPGGARGRPHVGGPGPGFARDLGPPGAPGGAPGPRGPP